MKAYFVVLKTARIRVDKSKTVEKIYILQIEWNGSVKRKYTNEIHTNIYLIYVAEMRFSNEFSQNTVTFILFYLTFHVQIELQFINYYCLLVLNIIKANQNN